MNTFQAIIFFHVTSAIALFVAWALEYKQVTSIKNFSAADSTENGSSKELKKFIRYGRLAMLTSLCTGISLMVAFCGHGSWMMMAMVSLLLIIIVGIFFSRRASFLKKDKNRSFSYLVSSIRLRRSIGTGIIALMVFKTNSLLASLLIVFVFVIGVIIWVLPVWKIHKL